MNNLVCKKRNTSDSTQAGRYYTTDQATDLAWNSVMKKHPEAKGFYCSYPDSAKPASTINITIYPTTGKYYNNRGFAFDQHTLKMLPGNKAYDLSYEESAFAGKLQRKERKKVENNDINIQGKS